MTVTITGTGYMVTLALILIGFGCWMLATLLADAWDWARVRYLLRRHAQRERADYERDMATRAEAQQREAS